MKIRSISRLASRTIDGLNLRHVGEIRLWSFLFFYSWRKNSRVKAQWGEGILHFRANIHIAREFCKVYSIAQIFGVFNVVQNLYIRTYLGNTSFLGISLLKKFLSNFDSTEDFTLRIFFKFLFDI